jgi:hypothetical protein
MLEESLIEAKRSTRHRDLLQEDEGAIVDGAGEETKEHDRDSKSWRDSLSEEKLPLLSGNEHEPPSSSDASGGDESDPKLFLTEANLSVREMLADKGARLKRYEQIARRKPSCHRPLQVYFSAVFSGLFNIFALLLPVIGITLLARAYIGESFFLVLKLLLQRAPRSAVFLAQCIAMKPQLLSTEQRC